MLEDFEKEISIDNFHKLTKKTKRLIFDKHLEIIERIVKDVLNNEKRYNHSISVANVMKELARVHKIDENKAYIAGLLHDITKYLDIDDEQRYLECYDPLKLNAPKGILHSYTAKYYIKEKFNFYDSEVINAIYHHADGLSKSKMAMMLYIADKRDPLRNLDPKILLLAFEDLNLAFSLMKDDVKEYLKIKNERIN